MSTRSKEAEGAVQVTAERMRALKRIIPKKAILRALEGGSCQHRYCRKLPRWFMVWFAIALSLFSRDCYRQVYKWLNRYRKKDTPGRSTLCEARHSIGAGPLRRLAEDVIELQASPDTPHAFYHGMRLMAMDSFVVNVPDTPANERAFGRPGSGRAAGAFPQARVLSLCEAGTHVLWKSQIKPCRRSEQLMAPYVLRFLVENMLLLWDRGFLSYDLVRTVLARKAQLLARVKSNMVFKVLRRLKDGSYLSKLYASPRHRERDEGGIVVRIIEYTFRDSGRPGSGEKHRLLTTLLDEKQHPAKELIVLYHERWEEEIAFDELKTHQRERPVLRSQTPGGVVQELYGYLLGHFVIRKLMSEAADAEGCAPRELSFVGTLKILRCRLPQAPRSPRGLKAWYEELLAEVGEERLEPRRNRINPRVIKCKMSRWPKKREKHYKPPQPTKTFPAAIAMLN